MPFSHIDVSPYIVSLKVALGQMDSPCRDGLLYAYALLELLMKMEKHLQRNKQEKNVCRLQIKLFPAQQMINNAMGASGVAGGGGTRTGGTPVVWEQDHNIITTINYRGNVP